MKIKTKFDVGQKVWFIYQHQSNLKRSGKSYCCEGIVKSITVAAFENVYKTEYVIEYFDAKPEPITLTEDMVFFSIKNLLNELSGNIMPLSDEIK